MKLFLKFTVFVLPTCFFIAFGQVNPPQFLNGNLNNTELKIVELNQTKAMPNRTSQSETIRKAGDDLRLGEEGSRVGAAKLLGKYPSSFSSKMLVGALNDKSNLVRRAAIVSSLSMQAMDTIYKSVLWWRKSFPNWRIVMSR